ncbi:MAG: ribonuclease J [Rhodospirillales bacterium]|mgnify:CR=1 FL=1|jgi:ribonuclease J|nr:MBL fold hydrolase [Rhodospirillaceae bacterium]MDP6427589.1 ribonuclease J [Rhodospirillales bacterium]MDP6643495.1 ribonuclease J [Rhodospirillales bacterium]MDP6840839.1 ribonuclease J [Rhodospirillales bacterium]|tara:strand:- start:1040 stop:2710 length:1671 start_codon:yes stop_codon:yes gene_type:complete
MMAEAEEELLFVPLGGAEEIGMNFNLYGFGTPDNHQWLIIDLGIAFGDDTTPSIDVIVPDPEFIEERRKQLAGIVLTHGHEDHLGAVPYLWQRLRCPVYATPFTAALLRKKLEWEEEPLDVEIIEVPLKGKFSVGPFELELITLTHSMPEPNAVVLRTPLGNIFHTGDWKFDPEPVVGPTSDEAALRALGDEGVLAAIGDSTNVFVEGVSGSEASLLDRLSEIIGRCRGQVAVACFASNVARLKTIFDAASNNGRAVALVGRSLWRINAAARETGYLTELPPFLEPEKAAGIPDDEILYICTGSQGEPRAALTRIAADDHRSVSLGPGDTVIFSSRIIPGNELAIGRIHNRLVQRGVDVVSELDENIHVSGHPARDELTEMYQLVRPQMVIPVHGEQRHLKKHAELAAACQVPHTLLVENGSVVRIAPGEACIIDEAPVGRLALDSGRLVPLDGQVVRERSRVLFNGSAVFTLIVDAEGCMVAPPKLTMHGLADDDEAPYVLERLTEQVKGVIEDMDESDRRDDEQIGEMSRRAIRRSLRDTYRKRPLTTVHVVRI